MRGVTALIASLASIATTAHAALGGAHASIDQDRVHFAATMATVTTGTVHVAMLRPTNGGTIHEYSTADGTVFAVTWRGPGRPDLRQLLGDRFDTVSADMAARTGRRTVRLVRIRHAELVVRSQGRPGAFSGFAYDPRLIPSGFTLDDPQ